MFLTDLHSPGNFGVMLLNTYAKCETNISKDFSWSDTQNLNILLSLERGHNLNENFDRVTSSWILIGVMFINMYAKYQSNILKKKWKQTFFRHKANNDRAVMHR